MRTIGRPGGRAAVRSLRFADVVATYVVDGYLRMRPAAFFPDVPSEYWSERPELLTADGELLMSAGGLLIERDRHAALIDAGVGPMTTDFVFGKVDTGSMIDVLSGLGQRPEHIDVLAFTHLHFDHSGWAFTNGVKTFPAARYVVAAQEWARYVNGIDGVDATTPRHVVAGLAAETVELVDDGDDVAPGVRAIVTAGHTPGHTAYVITACSGERLVVLGDAFHCTAQLAHQDWLSVVDVDAAGVVDARRRLIDELSEPGTLGFAFHFGDQTFGRLVIGDGGQVRWKPVRTSVLGPPPR